MPTATQVRRASGALACAGALLLGTAAPVLAADPVLQQAIARGKEIFQHNAFGGHQGRVCETCHVNGGMGKGQRPDGVPIPSLANAAAIFPRIDEDSQHVITLADKVRACVGGAIRGTPPEYGSDTLNALVLYVTSLAQGKSIQMGGEAQ